ncbi:MAG: amino acid--[acyl-carrier-protein] ligase [Acidimicrobiales bacterium]
MERAVTATGESNGSGSTLLDRLFDEGLLVPSGVPGLYGRSATYQQLADGVSALVSRWAAELRSVKLHFPPLLPRHTFAATGYAESFPDLMGSVHVFGGGEREHRELRHLVEVGGDWPALLVPSEVVLCSAACHGVYPQCTGNVPAAGRYFDVSSYCFRHEPSDEPTRLQCFVQHEVVCVGDADAARLHRDAGLERGVAILGSLGLDVRAVPASDPFFGRAGRMLSASQLDEKLKVEAVADVCGDGRPTALLSANCHGDHFGRSFGIETAPGETAHSSCIGFGVDRVVIALLSRHGLDPTRWAPSLRSRLRL